jgi:amino-acid N-acetyltransferase
MPFSLRAARSEDLSTVEALLVDAELPVGGLRDQFPSSYLVAEDGGQLIAAVGLEPYSGNGLLRSLVVRVDRRGGGVGRALIERALEAARAQRLQAVYLLTQTAPEYFRKFGFFGYPRADAPDGVQRSPEFGSVCPTSATCMRWST